MALKDLVGHITPATTPQSAPLPGRESEMVRNPGGGYTFAVDDWKRLDRFLILGSEASFYVPERQATIANADVVRRCLVVDGKRVVDRIVEVSDQGLAPKNDPAILALALACKLGDDPTRKAAYAAMPKVCRIGTHLFGWAEAINSLGGWGRGARTAVRRWYEGKDESALAYQAVKYRQRNGWTHTDMLRLAHPKHSPLYTWIVGKQSEVPWRIVEGFEAIQKAENARDAAHLITQYKLPREAVPSTFLAEPVVLEALLQEMPITAMLRNLGTLSKAGVVKPFADATKLVLARLSDDDRLKKGRVHPIAVLLACKVYASGKGVKGSGAWTPVPQVVDALDGAFYACLNNIETTGKRYLLAVDVSGSMSYGGHQRDLIAGVMKPSEAAAAMMLVTAKAEPNHAIIGFDGKVHDLGISAGMRLADVNARISAICGGTTDCSLPMAWVEREKLTVDAIIIHTDNISWAGQSHASQALRRYRRAFNPACRMVSAAYVANEHSVVDPKDPLALDCVGLDASTPEVIRSFCAGQF